MPTKLRIPAREITAYRFDELDDNAKDVVRDWLSGDDPFVTDDATDSMQYELEKTFDEVEISEWDLDPNYRGLSFSGHLKDEKEAVAKAFVSLYSDNTARHLLALQCRDYLDVSVRLRPYRGGGYLQIKTEAVVSVDLPDFDLRKEAENLEDDLQQYFQDLVDDAEGNALSIGQKEYDRHFSDEYVQDACEANEYWFNEKGKPVHQLGGVVTDKNA